MVARLPTFLDVPLSSSGNPGLCVVQSVVRGRIGTGPSPPCRWRGDMLASRSCHVSGTLSGLNGYKPFPGQGYSRYAAFSGPKTPTELKLMESVRRNAAKNNTIFETILPDLERPEAVTNKNPWFLIRPWFGLWIKHFFDSV